jgi:hypothetical protein
LTHPLRCATLSFSHPPRFTATQFFLRCFLIHSLQFFGKGLYTMFSKIFFVASITKTIYDITTNKN